MEQSYFFLLGADDPEMQRIIEILMPDRRHEFALARTENGMRVHPGNAYQARREYSPYSHQLVVIECAFEDMPKDTIVIDHHRPGDPGFDKGPERYWEASSIGQLYQLLELGEPTQEDRVLAAMDHCAVAGWLGKCPGARPQKILARKIASIVARTGVKEDEVHATITRLSVQLRTSDTIQIDAQTVIDFRAEFLGIGYSLLYLCAQVALLLSGQAALLRGKEKADESDRITLSGHASEQTLLAFMQTWAPANGIQYVYGVPSRGYAGGYVSP